MRANQYARQPVRQFSKEERDRIVASHEAHEAHEERRIEALLIENFLRDAADGKIAP